MKMTKLIHCLGIAVFVASSNVVVAQADGVITYEVRMNLHRRLPPERADMKSMIPEYRTARYQLFFNGNESLYKLIQNDEEDMATPGVRARIQEPNREVYFDQASATMLSRQEFMGRYYLIEDSLRVSPWKFGNEIKVILGYECRQAFFTDEIKMNRNGSTVIERREITAWYTDKLRSFLGPERFNSLPGAVLALDVNSGEQVIVAREIDLRALKRNELKAPSNGKEVTQEEFREMVEEQRKQGGDGRMIMRN